jgi:DNA-binding PadR family transcriptional regulator
MAIKYAVLGLIVERRGYGYDLVHRLHTRLGPAWQLSSSAVYTALDTLEAEHLIEGSVRTVPKADEPRPSRRSGRVVYQATTKGEAAFRAWLQQTDSAREPIRSELLLKIALADAHAAPALIEAVEHEAWRVRQLQTTCSAAEGHGASRLVTAAVSARLDSELEWLGEVRAELEAFYADG